jgi:hypothetical protein
VLFKSFWGWSPDTWGALGWPNTGRRDTICKEMTDPFILVCNVPLSAPGAEEYELGKIVGFYLISHERGDRDTFTDPVHHTLEPEKWRYSLRAIRAFTYLPEYRLDTRHFDASLLQRAQAVGTHGEVITDEHRLKLLRETPWEEVRVYQPRAGSATYGPATSPKGWVRAGPENQGGYAVPAMTQNLTRHLYILRLDGPTDAFLGTPANGRRIVKIGLAVSPESRRTQFQAALPRCAFEWKTYRTTLQPDIGAKWTFQAAEAGEYAMKRYLAAKASHLDGEFYLASDDQINEAWRLGVATAQAFPTMGAQA